MKQSARCQLAGRIDGLDWLVAIERNTRDMLKFPINFTFEAHFILDSGLASKKRRRVSQYTGSAGEAGLGLVLRLGLGVGG
jgi:hypothetical protein